MEYYLEECRSAKRGFFTLIGLLLPFLLVLRSSLDPLQEFKLSVLMNVNLPALYGVMIGLVCLAFVIYHWRLEGFYLDGVSRAFLLFLLLCLFVGLPLAYLNYGKVAFFEASREWVRSFVILAIYLAFFYLARDLEFEFVVMVLLLSLIVPMALGFYQVFESKRLFFGIKRIWGTFSHPNQFSFFLAMFMGLTLWKMKHGARGVLSSVLWLVLLFGEATLLCFTWSKGGVLMLIMVLGVMVFLPGSVKFRLLCLLLVAYIGCFWLFSPSGKSRLKRAVPKARELRMVKRRVPKKVTKRRFETSIGWRLAHWKLLISKWKKKPFLGYGFGVAWKFVSPWREQPHNDFLRFLVELGILGLAVWVGVLFVVIRSLFLKARRLLGAEKELAYVILAIFVAAQVCALYENMWRGTCFQMFLWALVGLVLGRTAYRKGESVDRHRLEVT